MLEKKGSSCRGFTLLELLVALSIFAVVMVMVTTGLKTVLDLRSQMKVREQRLHQLQFAFLILERDFMQIIQYGDKVSSLRYSGSGAIEFMRAGVLNPMARHARSTLERVNYSVFEGALIRSTSDLKIHSKQEGQQLISMALLYGVDDFKVRFWTHQKTWTDRWPEEKKNVPQQEEAGQKDLLPRAVVFTLKIKGMGLISRVFSVPIGSYYVAP